MTENRGLAADPDAPNVTLPTAGATPLTDAVDRLKPDAVGLVGVIFMAVATAAPIAAMVGNLPIAIGFGNGAAAPAGYLVATIILALFALGYSAMAKHITATGAFYGFISHGLGRVAGLTAGSLTTLAYVVFEAALVGLFAYFCSGFVAAHFGTSVSWIWFALLMLAVNAALTYFDVNLTAKVLGVFLVTEIFILCLTAGATLADGAGPEGWAWSSLNPIAAFTSLDTTVPAVDGSGELAVVGSAGLGLFFAFWSWVGFESTAMYGEESKNPKTVIPRATMGTVVGVGVFYVLISWIAIMGTGPTRAIALAQDPARAADIFLTPLGQTFGSGAVVLFEVLLITGSFACGLAFHNCAARYIYAIGRENLIPGTGATLGKTHPVHGSPYAAGFVQTAVAAVIVSFFFATGRDPYGQLFALMALLGTTAIMLVQAAAAFAAITYFHVHRKHPETAHWFTTFVAPLIGGSGMLAVVYLLLQNADFAAGAAASDWIFASIPWIVAVTAATGAGYAIIARSLAPQTYELIGRVCMEDTAERA
jgi:amino acid transporter